MKPYYDEDGITIYHGDCREVLPQVHGVDVVVTSPPYNTLGARSATRTLTGMHRGNGFFLGVRDNGYADDMDETTYVAWQQEIGALIAVSSRPGASFFYNHKLRYRDYAVHHPLHIVEGMSGWRLRQEIIWSRPGAMAFNARMFAPSDERIYWLVRDGAPHKWDAHAASRLTVWSLAADNEQEAADHPATFPRLIPVRCIAATSYPGDMVLDPYAGSGTTLVAAKQLGRRAIGIEIEERYCEIAAQRLAQRVLLPA